VALTAKQYHYWALGHIHDYAILSEHPHIVYPGVLQGRKITETGVKGAVLVEVEDGAVRSVKPIPLDVIRWARVEVDCAALENRDELHQRMRAALRRSIEGEADGRPLVVRVILTGTTVLHSELQDTLAPLREELRAIATEVDASLWIEKLSLATSDTVAIASHVPEIGESDSQDLFAMLDQAFSDQELLELLASDFSAFLSTTPPPTPGDDSLNTLVRNGDWESLVSHASAALRARLLGAQK
jgi:DNA repair exonuclease SbcCD nuclease subunit